MEPQPYDTSTRSTQNRSKADRRAGREVSSPRTWGCSGLPRSKRDREDVLPTHVGVLRWTSPPLATPHCPPHARGGAPLFGTTDFRNMLSSPRTWGCSIPPGWRPGFPPVLPTHVGVLRRGPGRRPGPGRPPHARRGAPCRQSGRQSQSRSSPRTWGCSEHGRSGSGRGQVLPTHVGVLHDCDLTTTFEADPLHTTRSRGRLVPDQGTCATRETGVWPPPTGSHPSRWCTGELHIDTGPSDQRPRQPTQ